MRTIRPNLFALSLILSLTSTAAFPDILGTATVGVVLDNLISGLNGSINSAIDRGDYSVARAATQAKDAIDAWRIANTDLLNRTFDSLDKSQRDIFRNANALLEKANGTASERLESANQLVDNATALVENIPVVGQQRTFATRYSPRIVPAGDDVILTIRGVNFGEARPQLFLNDKLLTRTSLTQNEVQFEIPKELVGGESQKMSRTPLKFTYSTTAQEWYSRLIGGRNIVERELMLIVLPKEIGVYSYKAKYRVDERIERSHTADLGQFKGRNERKYKVANPPPGMKWDLGKPLSLVQGHGESGRCEGIDTNASSENGVSVFARLDEKRELRNLFGVVRHDGYVSCSLVGTTYSITPATRDAPEASGTLVWGEPIPLKKPENTVSQLLTIKLFNGQTDTVAGSGHGEFFEVRDERDVLIVSPVLPPR